MAPLDKNIIKRKTELIESDLERLKEVKAMSLSEFLDDSILIAATERWLQRIAGRLIDINYHILKEDVGVSPKDYYDSFELMQKNSFVEKDVSENVAPITGLRNRLAHEYDEIDNQLLYESVHSTLQFVPKYLLQLTSIL